MKITKAIAVKAWGGFYNEDLAAVKSGMKKDGFFYLGKPLTPGFERVRTPTEAASILLFLSDGQIVCGDCLSVQYAGAGGRSPRFNHKTQLSALREVCDYLTGRKLGSFLSMCEELEAQKFDEGLNTTAAFYGASQALLLAVAAAEGKTGAEVLAAELGRAVAHRPVPIYVQCGEDRYTAVDKAILRRAEVLPHGLINSIEVLGQRGEKLQEYVAWIVERLHTFGSRDHKPEIHIDAYGLLGKIFDCDTKKMAAYIAGIGEITKPLQFCMETPVLMDSRAAQIEMFAAIRRELERLGSTVQLIVDEWANDIHDIREFIKARATHMVNVKSPDLGSIHNAARAILECKAGGVRPILGGSCNDSDQSGRVMCHVALASEPSWILARPGMGLDEGFQIVHNEMARTLAIIAARNSKSEIRNPKQIRNLKRPKWKKT